MGRMLGFIESFPSFRMGSRPWAFVGPVDFTGVCVFKSGLSTPIRVSLIVAPDSTKHGRKASSNCYARIFFVWANCYIDPLKIVRFRDVDSQVSNAAAF